MPDVANAITSEPCGKCHRPIVRQAIYNANREAMRASGFVRHAAGDRCNTCYTLDHRPPPKKRPQKRVLSSAEVARLRTMVGAA